MLRQHTRAEILESVKKIRDGVALTTFVGAIASETLAVVVAIVAWMLLTVAIILMARAEDQLEDLRKQSEQRQSRFRRRG